MIFLNRFSTTSNNKNINSDKSVTENRDRAVTLLNSFLWSS